jgi:hypothetical protein
VSYHPSKWRTTAAVGGLLVAVVATGTAVAVVALFVGEGLAGARWYDWLYWLFLLPYLVWLGGRSLLRSRSLGVHVDDAGVRRVAVLRVEELPWSEIHGVERSDEGYFRDGAVEPEVRLVTSSGISRIGRAIRDPAALLRDIRSRLPAGGPGVAPPQSSG